MPYHMPSMRVSSVPHHAYTSHSSCNCCCCCCCCCCPVCAHHPMCYTSQRMLCGRSVLEVRTSAATTP
jgi:hypothetical protein